MTLQEFITSKRSTIVKSKLEADINSRWSSRVVPNGWHNMGKPGAEEYLSQYGKSMGVDKAIAFAKKAEREGKDDMAVGFWEKAFKLTPGAQTAPTPPPAAPAPPKAAGPDFSMFPVALQPGKVPVKLTGKRANGFVLFGTPKAAAWQGSKAGVIASPSKEMDEAATLTGQIAGPFIVYGQEFFIDANGDRHTDQVPASVGQTPTGKLYVVHGALYAVADISDSPKEGQREAAENIVAYLEAALADSSPDGQIRVELAA